MSNRIRIYDKDILKHEFEYCLRESDGKECWYDHVTGEIYPEPEKEDKGYDSVVYLDNGTQYIDLGIPPNRGVNQEWISVKDRLPDSNYGSVLIYTKDGGVAEGQYYDTIKAWLQFRWSVEDAEVTHWMPLPEPPENE